MAGAFTDAYAFGTHSKFSDACAYAYAFTNPASNSFRGQLDAPQAGSL